MRALLAVCFLAPFYLYAQTQVTDSLRISTYNLLYYGATTTYCTSSNNNVTTKDGYLKTIVQYLQPDILVVNEMGCNSVYATRILTYCLNIGTSKYKSAPVFMKSSQDICNALFYNSEKLSLTHSEEIVVDGSSYMTRSAGLYRLTYNAPGLNEHKDSSNFWVVATHLKAGNTSSDASIRASEAGIIMKHIQKYPTGNAFLCGDLNLYRSSEGAWSTLTTSTHKLNDPINKVGSWTGNSVYSAYHTQSTVTSGTSCQSGGGLDDRFDFILASDGVMNGSDKVKILPETYRALGQDGQRFNQSIDNPTNNTLSSGLIHALSKMSDHLPVFSDFSISYSKQDTAITTGHNSSRNNKITLANPYEALFFFDLREEIQVSVLDFKGQIAGRYTVIPGSAVAHELPAGIYLVSVLRAGYSNYYKWIKP